MKKSYFAIGALLALFLLTIFACWRTLPYNPLIPKDVRLRSAVFLRAPAAYRQDPASYVPGRTLLAPEWVRLIVEREKNLVIFESTNGESIQAELGKRRWKPGCENQYRIETFPLSEGLTLGPITFQQPELVVVCDMWAASEKIRPGRVVIRERSVHLDDPDFLGVQCNPEKETCLFFGEGLGELAVKVIDGITGKPLPTAHIILTGAMGKQEYTGGFRLPVYEGLYLAYRVSVPGYEDLEGTIMEYFGNRLDVMHYTNLEHSQGSGNDLELPGYGGLVETNLELTKK